MTEKRFELAYSNELENDKWWAVRDGDITLWKEEVVGLLNELNDENEQLKQRLETYDKGCREIYDDKRRLEKENEHIKQTIREAYETERTQIGHNVLKQLLEAIE